MYQFHKLMRQAATPFYRREKCLTWTDSSGGEWREARWRERHTRGDGKWHCRIEEIFGWHLFLHHCRCFLPVPSFQVLVAGQGCGQGQVGSSSGVGELSLLCPRGPPEGSTGSHRSLLAIILGKFGAGILSPTRFFFFFFSDSFFKKEKQNYFLMPPLPSWSEIN